MLWIISAAAVAGIAAASVFAALWWRSVRWGNCQMERILQINRDLTEALDSCDHWKHEACVHLERERSAAEQAKLFERVGETMEEHATAERGRADRLAAALRESENKRERLQQQMEGIQKSLTDHIGFLENAIVENRALKSELDERGNTVGRKMDMIDRELSNIFSYNGTSEGQVNLNDE